MSNKNYTGHTESFQIDKGSNEIVVHHTDYNSAGRRSYDYSLSGSGYQSDVLAAQGKPAESDRDFVHKLVTASYGRFSEYSALVAGSVSKWDRDRLYTTDTVLIVMGLTEAETFPEIPVKVSINEYVEISKYYSTPKSRGFVNGLLDRLIKEKGLL